MIPRLRMAKATLRPTGPNPAEGLVRRGWLSTRQAATYLGFDACADPVRAFRKFAKRKGIASARRGRVLLFDPRDLDQAIGAAHRRVTA